jgi:sulfopyruvate decarboxylase TPP-binding subunit
MPAPQPRTLRCASPSDNQTMRACRALKEVEATRNGTGRVGVSVTTAGHPDQPPQPLSADLLLEALRKTKITHVIVVPDTVQKAFLARLEEAPDIQVILACTEDEAIGINAGLYATHQRPILSIQNNGLFACVNTLRGIALDASVPTVMLIGQYGQKPETAPEASGLRMVRLTEPTLQLWDVPTKWLWSDEDLETIPSVYEQALINRSPAALLIPLSMRP